ncbi:phosphodiester glycosidase family protein [Paenibacillus sp. HJGM_3]|uniref:phosphodiester glycosidase family protein n=1 Tax=Paenibacillus sp. HJGM_3 TaxID=3379816 RepID=UPI0038595DEA
MSTAAQLLVQTRKWVGSWSWLKKGLLLFSILIFCTSSFLYLTPPGLAIREFLAETVITTQHRDWAWIFVGAEKRDYMVMRTHAEIEESAREVQDLGLINHQARKKRTAAELISEIKDVSGKFWKGKMIYVYDPTSIRVVTPHIAGEGERISSMTKRTGAVAGINGGGFIDPDGLGNGFAPIGLIMSDKQPIYTDTDDDTKQNIVGFTSEGTLLVGMYSLNDLRKLDAKEAVSFLAPRLIANGNPQITGDGGWGRAPRTAIAQKADGTIIFLAIDGRSTTSVGATLQEVMDLLLKEGAVNAGLLDGGASTELVVNNEVVTNPSSRYGERRLPSGLLVYDDPSTYVADRVWDGLTKINAGGAFDHPEFLREQEELKRKALQNPPKPTPTLSPQTTKTPEPTKTPESTPKPTVTPGNTGSGNGATGGAGNGATGSPTSTPKPTPTPTPTVTPGNTGGGTGNTGNTGGTGTTPVPTPAHTATPGTGTPTPNTSTPTPTPKGTSTPGNTVTGTSGTPSAGTPVGTPKSN